MAFWSLPSRPRTGDGRAQDGPKRRQERPKTAEIEHIGELWWDSDSSYPREMGLQATLPPFGEATWRPRRPRRAPEAPRGRNLTPGGRNLTPGASFLGPTGVDFQLPASPFPTQVGQYCAYYVLDTWPGGMREAIK